LRDRTLKERRALLNNRKRAKGGKGRELQRLRSEKVERSFAHTLENGGGRRTRLRGIEKNQKRYFILTAAYNLGVILRQLFGIGAARSLQGMKKAFAIAFLAVLWLLGWLLPTIIDTRKSLGLKTRFWKSIFRSSFMSVAKSQKLFCSTGC
jgi:transposase